MSTSDLNLKADRASGLSSLLEPVARPRDSRRRLRRFIALAVVAAVVTGLCVITTTRSWPAFFLFDLFYLLHDVFYLPAKGLLWTSWFPWCLTLWVPILGFILLGLWGWIIGADPSRWVQRNLIVWLVSNPVARQWGIAVLVLVAKAAQSVGLTAGFLRSVVNHGARESLDHVEGMLLSGTMVAPGAIDRALRFIDAERRLERLLPAAPGVAGYVYDLALLAHASEYGEAAARSRLADAFRGPTPSIPQCSEGLLAWLSGTPLKDELDRIAASYDRLDGWAHAAAGSTRGLPLPRSASELHGTVFELAGFALFPATDRTWAAVGEETLNAVDRLWTALMLGSKTTSHATALADDIRRARLSTCRELGRRRYEADTAPLVPLWQSPADPAVSGPLISISSGPN